MFLTFCLRLHCCCRAQALQLLDGHPYILRLYDFVPCVRQWRLNDQQQLEEVSHIAAHSSWLLLLQTLLPAFCLHDICVVAFQFFLLAPMRAHSSEHTAAHQPWLIWHTSSVLYDCWHARVHAYTRTQSERLAVMQCTQFHVAQR